MNKHNFMWKFDRDKEKNLTTFRYPTASQGGGVLHQTDGFVCFVTADFICTAVIALKLMVSLAVVFVERVR